MAVRSLLHQFVTRHLLRGAFYPFFRTEFHGLENIPSTGPVILTPNHIAYLDPFWIGCGVPRPIHFMTWGAVFKIPVFRPILWFFQCFPVEIETGIDKSALKTAQKILAAGEVLMIFPEGGRCVSGTVDPFKAGAFRLAIRLKVPVVPVTLAGAHEVWPLQQKLPRPGKLRVYFHPPMYFEATPQTIREKSYEAAELVRAQVCSRLDHQFQPADLPAEPIQ